MSYRDDAGRIRGGASGRRRCFAAAILLAIAAPAALAPEALAAEADDDSPLEGDWATRLSDRMKDAVGGATSRIGLGRPPAPAASEAPSGCPTIALLPGTEAQRVMASGGSDNQGVRYQYSLATVGRECARAGGRITIKVGAEGRVLLGPAGAAGRFDVPIRVAVFDDLGGRVVESRLFKVATTVPAGQAGVPFTFVSDPIALNLPGAVTNYSIKVGLDGGAKGAEPGKPRRAKPRKTPAEDSASR